MLSSSGQHVLAFNGENYNFRDFRRQYVKSGHVYREHSDTKNILAGFETSNIDDLIGMFSFTIYDRVNRDFVPERDLMGEMPLYYGWVGNHLVFASELKALWAFSFWQGGINHDALTLLARHDYIRAPHSILRRLDYVLILTLRSRLGCRSLEITGCCLIASGSNI